MQAYWQVLHEAAPSKRPALWRQMQQIVLQATAAQALRSLKALVKQQMGQNSKQVANTLCTSLDSAACQASLLSVFGLSMLLQTLIVGNAHCQPAYDQHSP